MTRKRTLSFFFSFLLTCTFFSSIIPSAQTSDPKIWALIVHGSRGLSFYEDTRYMYKVLNEDYSVPPDRIIYLSVLYPATPWFVDDLSTRNNVGTAINTTLASSVGVNDIVYGIQVIFVFCAAITPRNDARASCLLNRAAWRDYMHYRLPKA